MMREFCVRHKLGETAMEEIKKIIDASLIHAGRQFLSVAVVAKKPAAKKPAADRCKCEGKNKKGEPRKRQTRRAESAKKREARKA